MTMESGISWSDPLHPDTTGRWNENVRKIRSVSITMYSIHLRISKNNYEGTICTISWCVHRSYYHRANLFLRLNNMFDDPTNIFVQNLLVKAQFIIYKTKKRNCSLCGLEPSNIRFEKWISPENSGLPLFLERQILYAGVHRVSTCNVDITRISNHIIQSNLKTLFDFRINKFYFIYNLNKV